MKLKETLIETIKNDELQNVSSEIAETILDSVFTEGILKDIPIIGTIVGLGKGYVSIQDRLFAKKLLSFLYQLRDIPFEQRAEQILKIEESDEYEKNVGEKLLFIVEKASDSQKASMIGKLFAAYLKEDISYTDFVRCSEIINKASIYCLIDLIKDDFTGVPIDDEDDFINSGLFVIEQPLIELEKLYSPTNTFGEYELNPTEYKIKSNTWSGVISKYGKIIRVQLRK
jgi:hypothetical protein